MQEADLKGLTINSKCSLLSGVIKTSIKSGLLEGKTNPFDQVDYAASSTEHIYTAVEADYVAAKQVLKTLRMKQQLAIQLCTYCSYRYKEIKNSTRDSYDLDRCLMTITDAKNRACERVIPIPPANCEQLKEFDFQWGSNAATNNQLKKLIPELTSHSLRHILTRLDRELGTDSATIEATLGHRLSTSAMANVYGNGYSPDAMKRAAVNIWDYLDNL